MCNLLGLQYNNWIFITPTCFSEPLILDHLCPNSFVISWNASSGLSSRNLSRFSFRKRTYPESGAFGAFTSFSIRLRFAFGFVLFLLPGFHNCFLFKVWFDLDKKCCTGEPTHKNTPPTDTHTRNGEYSGQKSYLFHIQKIAEILFLPCFTRHFYIARGKWRATQPGP